MRRKKNKIHQSLLKEPLFFGVPFEQLVFIATLSGISFMIFKISFTALIIGLLMIGIAHPLLRKANKKSKYFFDELISGLFKQKYYRGCTDYGESNPPVESSFFNKK